MNKTERRELFKKIERLPKQMQRALTVAQVARHIKVMKQTGRGCLTATGTRA